MSSSLFYTSYNSYLQKTFGAKTYKIVVASGLTCPTRDGTLAKAGCAFCDLRGSSSYFGKKGRGLNIRQQIKDRLPFIRKRFKSTHFLAYFQSYTNTYSDIEYLKKIYEEALSEPDIIGLCIGTRPDCLPDTVLDLLEEIAKNTYVSLELGVQSFEERTLDWLARGHSRKCSLDALKRLQEKAPHVHICVHLIFGSPTDSPTLAKDTAILLNAHKIHGVKLHQLMILEHTELAKRWKTSPFPMPSLEEYMETIIPFINYLSPQIYLERLCSTATHPEECLAPDWSKQRWQSHNKIRELLREKNCFQGSKLI